MSEDVEALQQEVAALRDDYARIGRPILDRIVSLLTEIEDIKRERGELFYVDYMRYRQQYVEECDDLAEAKSYAQALNDAGDGYVMGIRGPGVAFGESDWDQ